MAKEAESKKATAEKEPDAAANRRSLVAKFATKYGVDPSKLLKTLKDTAFKQPGKKNAAGQWEAGPEVSDEQMMALLVVADMYGLNPFTREIYAFPAKGGGIVPVVSVDGWIVIINRHPALRSIAFDYGDDGTPESPDQWIACRIVRSDRDEPITVREYGKECYRNTDPWNEMPRRMLRHKALIQSARIAFGFVGIYDPEEAERIANATAIEGTATEIPRSASSAKPMTKEPKSIEAPKPDLFEELTTMQITKRLDDAGISEREALEQYGAASFEDLTPEKRRHMVEWIGRVTQAP